MSEEVLIQVDNLSRDYADFRAVDNISFSLRRGEVLGFLGPNGAGKTTTMRILSGNLAPSAGSVRINGHDILDAPRQAKTQLGYLPEQPPLYRELTVDEYLNYCARLNRIARAETSQAVTRAKHRCGLEHTGRRLIGNLSKGYQQRVGIAQAIIHDPALVILDEPTVGLDPIQIREIRELIRELGENHGVILSTHILPEVQAVCDRVLIVNRGRIALAESLSELNQRMGANALDIHLARPPEGAQLGTQLGAIAGVNQVHSLESGRFLLEVDDTYHVAQSVSAAAVAGDWGLLELTPRLRSLEQIFVSITCGDAGADGPPQGKHDAETEAA